MKSRTAFILRFMMLLCPLAMAFGQIALAGENKALKGELERSLSGKTVVSKIVFGGRAVPRGFQGDYPVNTLVYPESGAVTYRVEWAYMRTEVGEQEMLGRFGSGTAFQVSGIDLKDDRLELKLKSGSGDSARLKLMLGPGWQSRFDGASVQAQLARVFVLDQQPEPTQETAAASASQPAFARASPPSTSKYRRDQNAPKIEGRISEDGFQAVLAAFEEDDRSALSALSQDAAVLSRSFLAYQQAYGGHGDPAGWLQAISHLQDRLGKAMQPQSDGDVIEMNEVFKRGVVYLRQLSFNGQLVGFGGGVPVSESVRLLLLSDSAVDLFRRVPTDVEFERVQRAIIERARTAAISVEQSLDKRDLIGANRQYEQMVSSFDQLAPVQQYLQRTAAFRQDLESYVAASQLHEHLGASLLEQVNNIAHEQDSLQSSQAKPLTKAFLEGALPTDEAELNRRLDGLPSIKFDQASYEMPAKFAATTAANAPEKAAFLKGKLDDLDSKLGGVADTKAVVTQPQAMAAIGQELGEASLAPLKRRQTEIAEAERIRSELADNLTAVQAQIEQYQAQIEKREAEARARTAAENEAQRERESQVTVRVLKSTWVNITSADENGYKHVNSGPLQRMVVSLGTATGKHGILLEGMSYGGGDARADIVCLGGYDSHRNPDTSCPPLAVGSTYNLDLGRLETHMTPDGAGGYDYRNLPYLSISRTDGSVSAWQILELCHGENCVAVSTISSR